MFGIKIVTTCLDIVLGIFALLVAFDKNKTAKIGGFLMLAALIASIFCIWN